MLGFNPPKEEGGGDNLALRKTPATCTQSRLAVTTVTTIQILEAFLLQCKKNCLLYGKSEFQKKFRVLEKKSMKTIA